ncbi:MAG: energy-coupling factor ABC transporter permease [Verrucomicrobiota bacterium]
MHIPDGFLDAKTSATAALFSVAGGGFALRQVRRELPPRRVPLLGLAAAFLFAAQMVNFPVAGGTSGHLVGSALVAVLLGPSAAIVVMTTVLLVQCFLFADGGVTALGANLFNMGIMSAVGGYAVYRLVAYWLPGTRGRVTAIAFAGWCATVLAAVCCAGELAWSGTVPWSVGFPAMTGIHMVIGLGEGLLSALAFQAIQRTRPELLNETGTEPPRFRLGELTGYGLLAALGLAACVAPFACPWPDGLDAVAARLGLTPSAAPKFLPVLAADYRLPWISSPVAAVAVAGIIGVLVVFGLSWLLGRWLVPKSSGCINNS